MKFKSRLKFVLLVLPISAQGLLFYNNLQPPNDSAWTRIAQDDTAPLEVGAQTLNLEAVIEVLDNGTSVTVDMLSKLQ